MKLTTKGRYAVMAVVELASIRSQGPVRLAELAEKQEISLSYMEQLFARLKKHGIVRSVRGPGGGYMLAAPAETIPVSKIVQAVEDTGRQTGCSPIAPQQCKSGASQCKTHPLWALLSTEVGRVLASVTLADVCEGRVPNSLSGKATNSRNGAFSKAC